MHAHSSVKAICIVTNADDSDLFARYVRISSLCSHVAISRELMSIDIPVSGMCDRNYFGSDTLLSNTLHSNTLHSNTLCSDTLTGTTDVDIACVDIACSNTLSRYSSQDIARVGTPVIGTPDEAISCAGTPVDAFVSDALHNDLCGCGDDCGWCDG